MQDIIRQNQEAYNKIAHHFSGTRYDLWPELKQFEPLVIDGQNILDWGSGNGRLILLLKGKKVKYFGVDQSEELIKIAKKKHAEKIKDGSVKFFCTAKKDKKFPDEFFDLVFMVASFHHLPDETSRLKLLKKVYKEMKPGAKLIMTNWNLGSTWAKKKIVKKGWKIIGGNDFIVPWKNPQGEVEAERYYHLFTPSELQKLLEESGFRVERMDYDEQGQATDKRGGRNLVTVAKK